MRRCPSCHQVQPTENFSVVRDGKSLKTAICAACIRNMDIRHNADQRRAKREMEIEARTSSDRKG